MRFVLSCGVTIVLLVSASGDDKKEPAVDAAKLVGKWEPSESLPGGARVVVEFTADGKFLWTGTAGDKTEKVEGTYTLEGTRLTVNMKLGEKARTEVRTVARLSDAELTTSDARGMRETLKRAK